MLGIFFHALLMDYSLNFLIIISNNAFLVICMFFPQKRKGRLKQPLNVLLGTLLGCTITLHLCSMTCAIVTVLKSFMCYFIVMQIVLFTMRTSITSCLLVNVYYFYQTIFCR